MSTLHRSAEGVVTIDDEPVAKLPKHLASRSIVPLLADLSEYIPHSAAQYGRPKIRLANHPGIVRGATLQEHFDLLEENEHRVGTTPAYYGQPMLPIDDNVEGPHSHGGQYSLRYVRELWTLERLARTITHVETRLPAAWAVAWGAETRALLATLPGGKAAHPCFDASAGEDCWFTYERTDAGIVFGSWCDEQRPTEAQLRAGAIICRREEHARRLAMRVQFFWALFVAKQHVELCEGGPMPKVNTTRRLVVEAKGGGSIETWWRVGKARYGRLAWRLFVSPHVLGPGEL